MTFIVIYTESEGRYYPPYDDQASNYSRVDVAKYKLFDNGKDEVSKFILEQKDNTHIKDIKIFEAKQIPYQINVVMDF